MGAMVMSSNGATSGPGRVDQPGDGDEEFFSAEEDGDHLQGDQIWGHSSSSSAWKVQRTHGDLFFGSGIDAFCRYPLYIYIYI